MSRFRRRPLLLFPSQTYYEKHVCNILKGPGQIGKQKGKHKPDGFVVSYVLPTCSPQILPACSGIVRSLPADIIRIPCTKKRICP